MDKLELLRICGIAFMAVLGLLSVLAGAIRGLSALFPESPAKVPDPAEAAIRQAVAKLFPGSKADAIREIRES